MKHGNSCNLLIDADDTLWENNIYYERVIAEAQALLGRLEFGTEDFRHHLNEKEREHIPIYGYGTLNFMRSLVEAFLDYVPESIGSNLKIRVEQMALSIMDHPVEILDGVPDTLAYLSSRHLLFLVTKGDPQEQAQKIEASCLRPYFRGVEILAEKDAEIYRKLMEEHGWDPNRTWMIGNSPRSDINPAISAGMNAVFIPHPHTWTLEHEEPVTHARLLKLEKFADLCLHF